MNLYKDFHESIDNIKQLNRKCTLKWRQLIIDLEVEFLLN